MLKEIKISELVKMTPEQVDREAGCFGFYDWFCADRFLPGKAKRLLGTLRSVVATKTSRFDPDRTYAFFKNNCPGQGGLYDDIRICDLESGRVLYNVCPRNPWYGNRPTVAFDDPESDRWENPLAFDSMKDAKAWFKDPAGFSVTVEPNDCPDTVHLCRRVA